MPFAENRLFGRDEEIAYLVERCGRRGLTAVVGKPQMGKSWLLTEVARRLAEERPASGTLSLKGNGALVGYFESQGEFADMFPRAVQDLYVRWLQDAEYRKQALVVFGQQKEGLVGKMGKLVGGLVSEVSKGYGKGAELAGGLVKQMFDGLAQVDEDLKTGKMKLPELQLDKSRELLQIVCTAMERGAVLILDQWEKSPDLEKEKEILDTFLRRVGDENWPLCHVVVGARDDARPKGYIEDLVALYDPSATMRVLGEMVFRSADAALAMAGAVRAEVPATKELGDAALLGLIGDDPRVLARWTHAENVEAMRTGADLARVAEQANSYEYLTLTRVLGGLGDEDRALAIRLALLPLASQPEQWEALRPVALKASKGKMLDQLKRAGVLERSSPPSFGHATRLSAAVGWLVENCEEELREEAEGVIRGLSEKVKDAGVEWLPYLESLAGARTWRGGLRYSRLSAALCEAAYSLLTAQGVDAAAFAGISKEDAGDAFRLATMGLLNALNEAKRLEKLELRDALLEELRVAGRQHPEDVLVQGSLARGLMNTMLEIKKEQPLDEATLKRRDALLGDLWTLGGAPTSDADERMRLATCLYNTVNDTTAEAQRGRPGALAQREDCMTKLEALGGSHGDEAGVREWLAKGLSNRLLYAKREGDLEVRDGMLTKLQALGAAYPEDAVVRDWLSNGLYAVVDDAAREGDEKRQASVLKELRALKVAYPLDAAVRWRLAAALHSRELDLREGVAGEADGRAGEIEAMVREIRELQTGYPEDKRLQDLVAPWLA